MGQPLGRNMFLFLKRDDWFFERMEFISYPLAHLARLARSHQDDLIRLNVNIAPYARVARQRVARQIEGAIA
jgi:hypothetical protein